MTAMSKVVMVVAALALASGAHAAVEQVTFCQRYTGALNGGTINSANEVALIDAIVSRALLGNGTTSTTPAVRGIANSPIQRPFFLSPVDYINNSGNYNSLAAKLKGFFTVAFGCKEVTNPGTFSSDLKAVHQSMNITNAVWADFVAEIDNTLRSFGVIEADVTYAGVLLAQFAYGGPQQICNFAGDCPRATTLGSFVAGVTETDPSNRAWIDAASTTATPALTDNVVEINVNGYVHWDFLGSIHWVVQTDSSFAVLAGGFSSASGANGASTYTRQFTTVGDYYFKCGNPNHPTMTGTIRVTTGGSGGDAAGLSASIGVVFAAIAAVFVASRL